MKSRGLALQANAAVAYFLKEGVRCEGVAKIVEVDTVFSWRSYLRRL